jgi:2'-5' RNA ligase
VKATLALLTDRNIENRVNRLAWGIHRRWRTGVRPRCLPAHVSLKQPFEIGDGLDALEGYAAGLAAEVAPFAVEADGFFGWETVFGVAVRDSATLRGLHERLNRELPARFGDVSAPFDGDAYRFHLTVAAGGASPETYREIFAAHGAEPFPPFFTARELALFVYDEAAPGVWEYMVHTVLPLTGAGRAAG